MEASQELFWSTLNSAVQWFSTRECLRIIWGGRGWKALSKFGSPQPVSNSPSTPVILRPTQSYCIQISGWYLLLPHSRAILTHAIFENHPLRKLVWSLNLPIGHSSGGQPWSCIVITITWELLAGWQGFWSNCSGVRSGRGDFRQYSGSF